MPGDKTIVFDVKTGRIAVFRRSSNVIKQVYSRTPTYAKASVGRPSTRQFRVVTSRLFNINY